ncbi:MAG: DUF3768 domain-containing protein [Caldilineaceae bacterium]
MVQIVFDYDGSDLPALPFIEEQQEGDLLAIARRLSVQKDAPLSDVSFRFVEGEILAAQSLLPKPFSAPPITPDNAPIQLVFEQGGTDLLSRAHAPLRLQKDLLSIARELSIARNVAVEEVNLRFVDLFETLLSHYPAEDLAEPEDTDYAALQSDGGCRTCASGTPCQERIRTDVEDILLELEIPEGASLVCLQWMIQEGCSSLTQSTLHMADAFGVYWRTEMAKMIAAQNDAFRSFIGTVEQPKFGDTPIPGMVMITSGIQAMSLADQARILQQVRDFDRWTPENDPHGEHDFGSFSYRGERILFKFDYYDTVLTFGSENPADLSQTMRVLTIMTGSEY